MTGTEGTGFEQDGPDGASGELAAALAAPGPGEYRLRPSAFSAWRVTRETAKFIAGWCLGSWYYGAIVQVHVPVLGGWLTAPEGFWVIRYGTSSTGAGLYWAVPGELFESAYASADDGPRTRAEARAAAASALAAYAAFGPEPETDGASEDRLLAALLRPGDREPPGQITGSAL